jgi:hypothetical protein
VARLPGARQLASAAQGLGRGAGAALQSIEQASVRAGNSIAQTAFKEGSRGALAAAGYASRVAGAGVERAMSGRTAISEEAEANFARLSGGAKRIVKALERRQATGLGSGVRVEDVRAASEHLGVEVAVVKSEVTGKIRALRGNFDTIPTGLRRPDEFYLAHTHPSYFTIDKHLEFDIKTATDRIEAVIDWAGNVTHFNRTGIITNPSSSPINKLGYLTGNQ